MNILLATYNFYPYHWGGSEVYVFGLAKYLQKKGLQTTVIAAIPEKGFTDCQVIYQDEHLKVGKYDYEGVKVLGCHLPVTTSEVYSRYNPAWEYAWLQFLKQFQAETDMFDLLHLHAFTPLIGPAFIDAVKKTNPGIKTMMSYHVVENCPKGNMRYFGKSVCTIKPDVRTCTACMLQERTVFSENIAKGLAWFAPAVGMGNLPSVFQLKYLVKNSLEGINRFFKQIDRWIFFSEQTRDAVLNFDVAGGKTKIIRHGIGEQFYDSPMEKNIGEQIFVFIGRFKKLKGFHILLKAWLELEERSDRKLLLIGGADDLEKEIEQLLVRIKERKEVEIVGRLDAEGVRGQLQRAHCIIIPSTNLETGPLVFHEAIACGVNVIASDVGGCKELAAIYKHGCETFESGNVFLLTEKIRNFKYEEIKSRPMSEPVHYGLVLKEINDLMFQPSNKKVAA